MRRRLTHTAAVLTIAAASFLARSAPAQPPTKPEPAAPDGGAPAAEPAPDEPPADAPPPAVEPADPPPTEPGTAEPDEPLDVDQPEPIQDVPVQSAQPPPVDPPSTDPPPTETTAELLAADSIVVGPEYGEGAVLPPELEEEELDDRPWSQGTIVPGIGIGFGLGGDQTVVSFGLGASYYVIDGLAVGLNLGDTITIYSDDLDEAYPGFSDQIPTNVFRITPTLQYVFYRHETFSPYVLGGVGPVFYNNGGGVVGEWIAGPGIFIVLGGPVALDLGISFSSKFPEEAWEEAFSYEGEVIVDCAITDSLCSFDISPRVGIVLSF